MSSGISAWHGLHFGSENTIITRRPRYASRATSPPFNNGSLNSGAGVPRGNPDRLMRLADSGRLPLYAREVCFDMTRKQHRLNNCLRQTSRFEMQAAAGALRAYDRDDRAEHEHRQRDDAERIREAPSLGDARLEECGVGSHQ